MQISNEIKSRQQAVAELAQKREFCMEFETSARPLRNNAYDEVGKIMDDFFRALETDNPSFCLSCICPVVFCLPGILLEQ